ncbi:MAG: hypothetical protein ACJA2Q_000795 [Pseudohongiellaceae bacterium]|jgi:hypothetical protein
MKNRYKIAALLLVLSLIAGFGYYLMSPKSIVTNLSTKSYDEFNILLPTSRISIGPIKPNSSYTIFYSRQRKTGIGKYSLVANNFEISGDEFPYAEGTELGRVLRFTIESNGQISVNN